MATKVASTKYQKAHNALRFHQDGKISDEKLLAVLKEVEHAIVVGRVLDFLGR
jgi:hypothetical protein